MIELVFDSVSSSKLFHQIIVATDSEKVMNHCIAKNIRAMITSVDHKSGTDRIAEVAELLDTDIVINIQADEPFIEASSLKALVELMKRDEVSIGTLSKNVPDTESLLDYNVVKLVKDINDKVLYFSRQAIPAHRDIPYREWMSKSDYYQHLGIYAFKKSTLLEITKLPQHQLEMDESLEQLRWLGNGYPVHVVNVESSSFGIDTEEDLDKARELVRNIEFNQ